MFSTILQAQDAFIVDCIVMFVGLNMSELLCGIVYIYIIIHEYGYAVIKLLQYITYTV